MRDLYDEMLDLIFAKPTPVKLVPTKVIASTDLIKKFKNDIKLVYQNKRKGAFGIKFKDGSNITVHLQKGDIWDSEKALLMCFAKWLNGGKGNFNDIFDVLEGVVSSDERLK